MLKKDLKRVHDSVTHKSILKIILKNHSWFWHEIKQTKCIVLNRK